MKEQRVTVVIREDEDANEVTISAMGDHYLPAPIMRPRQDFRGAWMEFGQHMEEFLGDDAKVRGPWG